MNKEKKDIVSGSNLKFYWHANETGPSRRSVDLADFLVTQSSTTFCTELHGVSSQTQESNAILRQKIT